MISILNYQKCMCFFEIGCTCKHSHELDTYILSTNNIFFHIIKFNNMKLIKFIQQYIRLVSYFHVIEKCNNIIYNVTFVITHEFIWAYIVIFVCYFINDLYSKLDAHIYYIKILLYMWCAIYRYQISHHILGSSLYF